MAAVSYRVRRGLRSTWRSTAALTLAVAVGSLAVLAVAAGATRTSSAPDRYTASLRTGHDATITQGGGPPLTADIAALPSVASARTLTFVFGGFQVAGGGNDDLDALVFAGSVDATADRVVRGRAPSADQPSEFTASKSWVVAHHLDLGDTVPLLTLTQAQADEQGFEAPDPQGPMVNARLVGITDGPDELDDPTPKAVFGTALLDEPGIGTSASVVTVDLRPGRSVADVRRELDTLPGSEDMSIGKSQVVSAAVRTAIHAQTQSLWVVALVAFAAVVVTLGQLTMRQVRQATTERSALGTLGYTRRQAIAEMMATAAAPIVVGVLAGAVAAIAVSRFFPFGLARRVEPAPGLRVEWPVLAMGALVLAVALLGVVFGAILGAERRAPVRQRPTTRLRAGTLPRLWPSASTGVRLALDRTGSRRLTGGLVSITFAVMCLVGTLTFGSSMDRLVDEPARYGNNFDLAFGSGADEIAPELLSKVNADPDIRGITLYSQEATRVGDISLPLLGFRRVRGDLAPPVLQGRLPESDDEIALGRLAADQLGRRVGDTINVRRSGAAARLRIVGIAALPNLGASDGVGEGGLVSLRTLGKIIGSDGEAPTQGVAAGLAPGSDNADRAHVWRRITGTPLSPGVAPPSVLNLDRIRAIPRILAAVLALLATFTVVQLIVVAVGRRRRDLAVLGALGAVRRWRSDAVRWQCIATIVVPIALGVGLGVVGGSIAFGLLADSIGAVRTAASGGWRTGAVAVGLIAIGIVSGSAMSKAARTATPWLRVE